VFYLIYIIIGLAFGSLIVYRNKDFLRAEDAIGTLGMHIILWPLTLPFWLITLWVKGADHNLSS
jgi:hypothetical protein